MNLDMCMTSDYQTIPAAAAFRSVVKVGMLYN